MSSVDGSKDRLLDEFKEATSMHRFEAGLMFGQLTVYLAVFAALFSKVVPDPPPRKLATIGIVLVGMALNLSFFVIHVRAAKHLLAVIRHAELLEQQIGMSLYASRPIKRTLFSGINALTSIYVIGLVSWIVVLAASVWHW